ncbi:MAG: hypothetical protein OEM26_20850, partial [Saprospiraceae bacterium]|nr:hypothetical protein [Saprospiraceae bacterium]
TKALVGTYNCVGPSHERLLWKDFLQEAKNHLNSTSRLYWAPEKFLRANEVYSFSDLPLWAPISEDRGFMQISNAKIVSSGFDFTPWTKTLDDCLAWFDSEIKEIPKFGSEGLGIGLAPARESNLIASLPTE